VLDETLRLFDDHLGHLHVTLRGLVERGRNDFATHRPLHVGHFFRPLIDEQHDQIHLRVIGRNGLRDVLQQHRLTRAGRRDDEAALAFADGRHEVHDAGGDVVGGGLELEALLRIERRQVLEEELVTRLVGRLEVDRFHFDEREVPLAILGRPHLARHRIAGLQIKLADLRR